MRLRVHHRGKHVICSPTLSILLLSNALFSALIFVVFAWISLISKRRKGLGDSTATWYAGILLGWCICEVPRLRLGFQGNSRRSVPSMIGFILLTLCVHVALMLVFSRITPRMDSLDYALSVVQIIYGCLEILFAVKLLRYLVKNNTIDFYVNLGSSIPGAVL